LEAHWSGIEAARREAPALLGAQSFILGFMRSIERIEAALLKLRRRRRCNGLTSRTRAPQFNYIASNTVRMYDTRLARPSVVKDPLTGATFAIENGILNTVRVRSSWNSDP
jgi:hypothetical protein